MDFFQDNDEDYECLVKLIVGFDVGILINNVGQFYSIFVFFFDIEKIEFQSIVIINCFGIFKIIKVVVFIFVVCKKGFIFIMGFFVGIMFIFYFVIYSGSKVFFQYWSFFFVLEFVFYGVDVQFVIFYFVIIVMSKVCCISFFIFGFKQFVKVVFGKIGFDSNENFFNIYIFWWSYNVFKWIIDSIVGNISVFIIWQNRKMYVDICNCVFWKVVCEVKKQ